MIELRILNGQWVAKDNDPKIKELFGTDTLPTPYGATVPAAEALKAIQRLNPDVKVKLM